MRRKPRRRGRPFAAEFRGFGVCATGQQLTSGAGANAPDPVFRCRQRFSAGAEPYERDGALFEHWTHDAACDPNGLLPFIGN